MPRIAKCRRVCCEPTRKVFQSEKEETVVLQVEELESLRLMDFEGLDQDSSAKRMSVSRGTFQRILYVARQKVAMALVEGKSIVIEGGNFQVASYHCSEQQICSYCRFNRGPGNLSDNE